MAREILAIFEWGVRKTSPLEIREKLGETRPCPLSSERIPKSISVKLKPERIPLTSRAIFRSF